MVDHAEFGPFPQSAFEIVEQLLQPLLIDQLVVGIVENEKIEGEFSLIQIRGQGAACIGNQARGPQEDFGLDGLFADIIINDCQDQQRQKRHGEDAGNGLLPEQPEIKERFIETGRLIVIIKKSGFISLEKHCDLRLVVLNSLVLQRIYRSCRCQRG